MKYAQLERGGWMGKKMQFSTLVHYAGVSDNERHDMTS